MEKGVLWVFVYILIVTLLWPACVLLTSLVFGQFNFFKNYISKLFNRLAGNQIFEKRINIAVFASGKGSNAAELIRYFNNDEQSAIFVSLVVCNKAGAGVIEVAKANRLPVMMLDKEIFFRGDHYIKTLKQSGINYIVLAGFLWMVPKELVAAFRGRILNIHPSLLPKYGGKGMYGNFVHEAVIAQKEKASGITIHEVDEIFDNGRTVFQESIAIETGDDAGSLAEKIHVLEHTHFPRITEQWILEKEQEMGYNYK